MELAIVPPLRRPLRPERQPDPLRDRLAGVVEASALDLLDPARIEAMGRTCGSFADIGCITAGARLQLDPVGL